MFLGFNDHLGAISKVDGIRFIGEFHAGMAPKSRCHTSIRQLRRLAACDDMRKKQFPSPTIRTVEDGAWLILMESG